MRNHACCLDLPRPGRKSNLSYYRRESHQRLGKSITRKRLLKSGQQDRYKDGSNVVHRKNSEFTYSREGYVSCEFLNENDVVIAADAGGKVDVVRIPRYNTSERQCLGKALATNVHGRPRPRDAESYKLKSLQSGQYFAVGMPTGDYQVFATEHASECGYLKGIQSMQVSHGSHPSPYRGGGHGNYFISLGWRIRGPRRRYNYDREFPLSDQLRPNWYDNTIKLEERFNWDNENTDPWEEVMLVLQEKRLMQMQNVTSRWDFLETGSSLLAVHVGLHQDLFCLRVLDSRVANKSDQNCVCVDLQMDSNEQISAACFVNDHAVATAATRSSLDKATSSSLKLWDIRMMKKNEKESSDLFLPSFPKESIYAPGGGAKHYWQISGSWQISGNCTKSASSRKLIPDEKTGYFEIIHLTPSSSNGTLLATTRETRTHDLEHFVIDPIRGDIVASIEHNTPLSSTLPVFATDSSLSVLASSTEDAKKPISLREINPNRAPNCANLSVGESSYGRRHNATVAGNLGKRISGRKRVHNDKENETHDIKAASHASTINAKLCDGYGLETSLSCMAFNESGTSLIGGSVDGDIFAWRAS